MSGVYIAVARGGTLYAEHKFDSVCGTQITVANGQSTPTETTASQEEEEEEEEEEGLFKADAGGGGGKSIQS